MPIYEYICNDCGERFEVMRSMKAADLPVQCEKCTGSQTNRLLSLFNASSEGRVVAGGNSGCATCSSSSCASCKT